MAKAEVYSDPLLCLSESRKEISTVKCALLASGGKRTPLSPETGNWGQEAYTQRNLVTSLIAFFNQKSLLWQCWNILLIVTSFKLYDSLLLGKFISKGISLLNVVSRGYSCSLP